MSFFRDVMGWTDPILERFKIEEDLTRSCGWVWWHENVLAISDRPAIVNRDEQGRLHSTTGPSIAYRDGWALYHWHGVSVSQDIILHPETITISAVESEDNAEVRRVLLERYGEGRYLEDSGAKPIHADRYGTLYRKDIPGDEPLVMVKVLNSTPEPDGHYKAYYLRVPPDMQKAHEAIAWTFGVTTQDYRPLVET